MEELKNWSEVTRGLYRYVVATKVCYEIHILYDSHASEHCGGVLTAKASLFIAGEWRGEGGTGYFERECLLAEQPVFECLAAAKKDFEENMEG